MALEKELETYEAKLPELMAHLGKFVLIHKDQVADIFSSYEDAIKEGYKRFEMKPFLVKEISADQSVQFVTRFLAPAH